MLKKSSMSKAYVFFTPYRPWLLQKDLAFFDLARDSGFTVTKTFEKIMDKVMFEEDPGVRMHGLYLPWLSLTFKRTKLCDALYTVMKSHGPALSRSWNGTIEHRTTNEELQYKTSKSEPACHVPDSTITISCKISGSTSTKHCFFNTMSFGRSKTSTYSLPSKVPSFRNHPTPTSSGFTQ